MIQRIREGRFPHVEVRAPRRPSWCRGQQCSRSSIMHLFRQVMCSFMASAASCR
jgi:hypothetical protein